MPERRAFLRDLLLATKDGEWGKSEPAEDLTEMSVIRGADFSAVRLGNMSEVPARFIPMHIAERKRLQPYDILIETAGGTRDQPTGRTLFLRERLFADSQRPITCASFSRFLRVDPELAYPEFVFWYLQFLYATGQMEEHQVQHTGVSRFQYTKFAESTSIPIPPACEQRAIASILGTLDDMIELNRRMNETLEALAQGLFKSWFVDAASSKPKSWGETSIAELCEINSWTLGKNDEVDRIEYVEISEVQRGNIAAIQSYERGDEPSRARRRLRHGDTALSTVRPDRGAYFLSLNPSPSLIASTGFAVLTPTKAPWSFIHAAMTRPEVFEYLGQHADGGAYPAVRPEIIGKMTVPWPKRPKVLDCFHNVCAPLYERAERNRAESRTLAELRDALLPKLLSGELRLPIANPKSTIPNSARQC